MNRTLENAEADRTLSDVSEEHEEQDEEVPLISGRSFMRFNLLCKFLNFFNLLSF